MLRAALVEPAAEGVAQELAPLREGDGDELAQQRRIDVGRRRQRRHPQHRRVDSRRRLERLRRHVEQGSIVVAPLQHHREPAVVLAARARGHPVDHFLLQHEMLVGDVVARLEQVEQDRRRDVVGQVADDAKLRPPPRPRPAPRSRRRARRPRSPRGPASGATGRPGRGRARSRVSAPAALQQRPGERAAPRPDLDERLPGRGSTASTIASITEPSTRKCWPKRFLARRRSRQRAAPRYCGGSRNSM